MKKQDIFTQQVSALSLISYLENILKASKIGNRTLIVTVKLLLIRFLGRLFSDYSDNGLYSDLLTRLTGKFIFSLMQSYGEKRLIEHLLQVEDQSQTSESRKQVALILDKSNDGPRFGKKQLKAVFQYAGGHKQPIKTHGWFFLVAVLGNEKDSEIVFLRASMYDKGTSKAEWREGLDLLEDIGEILDNNCIPRNYLTVVLDGAYTCKHAIDKLNLGKWIFVGKAGGQGIVTLGGVTGSLAFHARRRMPSYRMLDKAFRPKCKIESYARLKSEDGQLVYFQGRFPKKYNHWKHRKRFIVTNDKKATSQWAFGRYARRWSIECYFRSLKQTFGLPDYHPQTSGDRYKVHVGIVILSYSFFNHTKRNTRGLGKLSIGRVKKLWVKAYLQNSSNIEFIKHPQRMLDLNTLFKC